MCCRLTHNSYLVIANHIYNIQPDSDQFVEPLVQKLQMNDFFPDAIILTFTEVYFFDLSLW